MSQMSQQSKYYSYFPSNCLIKIVEIAIEADKPLRFDYYDSSLCQSQEESCKIAPVQDGDKVEKILYKSDMEQTSPLLRVLKVTGQNDEPTENLLCETHNSLYVVHANILKQKKQ